MSSLPDDQCFVITRPDPFSRKQYARYPMPSTARIMASEARRSVCQDYVEWEDFPDDERGIWKRLYRLGFRCEKVRLVPVKR